MFKNEKSKRNGGREGMFEQCQEKEGMTVVLQIRKAKKNERKGLGKVGAETAEGYPERFERGQRMRNEFQFKHLQLATFNFFTRKWAKDSRREV